MLTLQISASHGPAECQDAAYRTLKELIRQAQHAGLAVSVLDTVDSDYGIHSAVVELQGEGEQDFLKLWHGTVQWIFKSPLRPTHSRKNWFVGVSPLCSTASVPSDSDVVFKACKASGPGGQHVNKTDSAIQATHVATGISVKVQSQRSQHANKKLALKLIAFKLADLNEKQKANESKKANLNHWQVKRGNPVRVFKA